MAPREPTRQQLSSRLAYQQNVPAFLQKLQNRVAGVADPDDEERAPNGSYNDRDEDGNYYTNYADDGRPPIPERPPVDGRPPIPTRPDDDPGSADEDEADEGPQVVVLREGKHLSAMEAENEKRKARGLAPLPNPDLPNDSKDDTMPIKAKSSKPQRQENSLSFSSSSASAKIAAMAEKKKKRKIVGDGADDLAEAAEALAPIKKKSKAAKKGSKVLLSFGDDEG